MENNPTNVVYMQKDGYNKDVIIVSSDSDLGFVNLTNPDQLQPIIRHTSRRTNASFSSIKSFAQFNGSSLIVVDAGNHCIRSVSRQTHKIAALAGQCGSPSQLIQESSFEEAVFNSPYDIVKGENPNDYYVLESTNRAIRKLDLSSEMVSSVYQAPDDNSAIFPSPKTMILNDTVFYIGVSGGIASFDLKSQKMEVLHTGEVGLMDGQLNSTAKFRSPISIQLLDNDVLVVLEDRRPYIRLIDLENKEVRSLNISEAVKDLQRARCLMVDQEKNRIYIGGQMGISVIECE